MIHTGISDSERLDSPIKQRSHMENILEVSKQYDSRGWILFTGHGKNENDSEMIIKRYRWLKCKSFSNIVRIQIQYLSIDIWYIVRW